MKKIGFAITSSYCTIERIIDEIIKLQEVGYEIIPIVSEGVITNNTRFGTGESIKRALEDITGKDVVSTIVEAEKFGPKEKLDCLVVAPATGNFIAKFAHGITDTTATMAAKATIRNGSPIVIGMSTNDGLGMNGENIMKLYNTKNIFLVPFGQDNYINKPNSLIAHFDQLQDTIEAALDHKQIQPVIKEYKMTKIHQGITIKTGN